MHLGAALARGLDAATDQQQMQPARGLNAAGLAADSELLTRQLQVSQILGNSQTLTELDGPPANLRSLL